jgi:transaldolase
MKMHQSLKIKIFADGAEKSGMLDMAQYAHIKGFTTNPSSMRKAGVKNYEAFARDILSSIKDRPISFEVFSDDFAEMYKQALTISSWGENVYVKIPVTNTQAQPAYDLISQLSREGIKQNVTALMTAEQVSHVTAALVKGTSTFISVFAGRIADTGRDPVPVMVESLEIIQPYPELELIWASPRELLNIFQANDIGCHIITATNDIIAKLALVDKDLTQYSLDTVQMFYKDALAAGFELKSEVGV